MQVSYNAARADNTRLQQLEVEVARYSHRADAAESAKLELQAQLQQLQQLQVDTQLHLLNLALESFQGLALSSNRLRGPAKHHKASQQLFGLTPVCIDSPAGMPYTLVNQ